jgi:hypothetical protein
VWSTLVGADCNHFLIAFFENYPVGQVALSFLLRKNDLRGYSILAGFPLIFNLRQAAKISKMFRL